MSQRGDVVALEAVEALHWCETMQAEVKFLVEQGGPRVRVRASGGWYAERDSLTAAVAAIKDQMASAPPPKPEEVSR